MVDSFPRQQARTHRFTLGTPRDLRVSPDGERVVFLRSTAGDEPCTSLWSLDLAEGTERLVADAAAIGPGVADSPAEQARRERVRERARGIVAYSADCRLERAVVVVGGTAWLASLAGGGAPAAPERLDLASPEVFDARIDPTGRRVAWCSERGLWAAELDVAGRVVAGSSRPVAVEDDQAVRWGQAELAAAEEMGRREGYWWAPDGSRLLVARVDDGPVAAVWISDPTRPECPPVAHRYPFAGTPDAVVTLWWVELDGTRREIGWDREQFPYLPVVRWPETGDASALALVERRDHRIARVLRLDPAGAPAAVIAERRDPAWVDWAGGTPDRLGDGRLLWSADADDTRRLTADDEPLTPAGLQVRGVMGTPGDSVVFTASGEPTTVELWSRSPAGLDPIDRGGVVLAAAVGGSTVLIARRSLGRPGLELRVLRPGPGPAPAAPASHAATPVIAASVAVHEVGGRGLRTGLVLPTGHRRGWRLPVLLRPYGGPGAQRVLADHHAWLEDQWWADQGFAVVVVDGRGTPGRGPSWERSVAGDLAGPVLDDQVEALAALAAAEPDLDLGRVGIMGWSFGGYLAALAVLRRPEVFHAAVAGAPVTDWRLYDTYYTERFLGRPDEDPGAYERSGLLGDAHRLRRPLMVVHGLADDNVLVAHSLRLSQLLVEAGRPHTVLPLPGITHMAAREEVAEHLLSLQLGFLAGALGVELPTQSA